MRELRPLGLSDDGQNLVLVDLSRGADGERFRVPTDERLRTALRSGAPRPAQAETRVESALSPREIQARLRTGASAEDVARVAGIPVGRIQRYEAPILAERARIASEARGASAPGPHRQTPGRPLGQLVDDRLREEGADPELVEWDATRRQDGTWLITLTMNSATEVRASWSWDPSARRVRAIDAGATALLAPAASTGPDSLIALAQAAGVAPDQPPREEANVPALAAGGEDGRRRAAAPSRSPGSQRAGGLVVVGTSDAAPPPAPAVVSTLPDSDAAVSASASTSAELGGDVPGGSPAPLPPQARAERPQAPGPSDLLPGSEIPSGSQGWPETPGPETQRSPEAQRPPEIPSEPPLATRVQREPDRASSASPLGAATAPPPSASSDTGTAAMPPADPAADAPQRESAPPAGASTRSGGARRRTSVPAWDDIMFGARRG